MRSLEPLVSAQKNEMDKIIVEIEGRQKGWSVLIQ